MSYRCLKRSEWQEGGYITVPLREEDMSLLKEWRNEQKDVLRQNHVLTDEDQRRYYRDVVRPSFEQAEPRNVLFSLLTEDRCIGYGGLTSMDWYSKRAEISFLVDTKRTEDAIGYRRDFTAFLTLMKNVAFIDLHFHRLFTETFDIRPLHISILEENGFLPEGRMREHVRIGGRYVDSLLHGCLKESYDDVAR